MQTSIHTGSHMPACTRRRAAMSMQQAGPATLACPALAHWYLTGPLLRPCSCSRTLHVSKGMVNTCGAGGTQGMRAAGECKRAGTAASGGGGGGRRCLSSRPEHRAISAGAP